MSMLTAEQAREQTKTRKGVITSLCVDEIAKAIDYSIQQGFTNCNYKFKYDSMDVESIIKLLQTYGYEVHTSTMDNNILLISWKEESV
jgi:hypothetical protein